MSEDINISEEIQEQIINKIHNMAVSIMNDWSDPRTECREILRLCELLKNTLTNDKQKVKEAIIKHGEAQCWEEHDCLNEIIKELGLNEY